MCYILLSTAIKRKYNEQLHLFSLQIKILIEMHLKNQGILFRLVIRNNTDTIIQLDRLLYIDILINIIIYIS